MKHCSFLSECYVKLLGLRTDEIDQASVGFFIAKIWFYPCQMFVILTLDGQFFMHSYAHFEFIFIGHSYFFNINYV